MLPRDPQELAEGSGINLVPPLTTKQRVVWGLGIKLEADSCIVCLRFSSSSDLPLTANEGVLQLGLGEWR